MLFSRSNRRYTIGRRHHLSLKFTTQLKRYINKQQTVFHILNTLSVKGTWSKMELLFLKQSRLNSSLLFSKYQPANRVFIVAWSPKELLLISSLDSELFQYVYL